MKLVPIRYDTPTPDLGRVDVGAIVAEGRSQIALNQTVVDVATSAAHSIRRSELENATAELELDLATWQREHAEKEYYDSSEVSNLPGVRLTEDLVNEQGELHTVPRHNIPAYEVQAQLYERYASNLIQSKSGNITVAGDRSVFTSKMNTVLAKQTENSRRTALLQAEKAQRDRALANLTNAMDARNYSVAAGIIDMSDLPPEQKTELRQGLYETQERDGFDNILIKNERPGLQRALDIVSEEKAYDAAGGNLSDKERLTYARQFRTALNALDAKDKAGATASVARLNRAGRRMIKAMDTFEGNKMSPSTVSTMREQLVDCGEKCEATLEELDLASGLLNSRETMYRGNPVDRKDFINTLEDRIAAEGASPETVLLLDEARKADKFATNAQREDALQFAKDRNIISPPPMDVKNIDHDWAEERISNRDTAQTQWKMQHPLLTKAESEDLARYIDSLGPEARIKYLGDVAQAFGAEDSKKLFNQLSLEEDALASSFAGQLMVDDPKAGRNIILGGQIMRDSPEMVRSKNEVMRGMNEFLAGAYSFSQGKAAKEAIFNTYVYLADKEQEYEGEYDPELMERAIEGATGGIIEYEGSKFPPPVRGMMEDDFGAWMDSLSPDYINELGGIWNWHDEEVTNGMKEGRIAIKNHGPNEYMLIDTQYGQPLMADESTPFVFRYSEFAPMVPDEGNPYIGRGQLNVN